MKEIWTIRALISWTTSFFTDKGCLSPRLDAEILLAHALKCQRLDLYLNPDKPVQEEERILFRTMVKRRAAREPVAYIIGSKEFWSMDFIVNQDVLIPRPETEHIVETVLAKLESDENPFILDLGTGSGCIAIALAKELEHSMVVALDKSSKALDVARKNAEIHGVSDRITFLESSWFKNLESVAAAGSFNVIVSNPPYISHELYQTLQPEIRQYEPEMALIGGSDGVDEYRLIISQARQWLRDGGWLVFEIGDTQDIIVRNILAENGFQSIETVKDASGRFRIAMGKSNAGIKN